MTKKRVRAKLTVNPEFWVGWAPNGIGQQKPNHIAEIFEIAWDNRAHPKYAWI